jgi:diketogulonate reductase-like aldo/keto reductase
VILKAWGTWSLFQALLAVLRDVGDRHGGVSIANVAARWVLDHPFVGAVIIGTNPIMIFEAEPYFRSSVISFPPFPPGARLGVSEHADDNQHIFEFTLTEEDQNAIEVVLTQSNGRRMISLIGDCGAEYR